MIKLRFYFRQFCFYSLLFHWVIFSSSCKHAQKAKEKAAAKPLVVDWVVAQPTTLEQSVTISGSLRPFEETELLPEVSGRIVQINLREGQLVKTGTLLVKLFDGDLQAQLHKAEAQLQITEQNLQRQKELIKVNGISQAEFEQTSLQASTINAEIEIIKTQIRKTEVLAPFDGTIGLRNVSLGAVVSPGTQLTVIRDLQKLKIDFSVSEQYSSLISIGTKLKFTVQGDEHQYQATVIATENSIDANTRNLKARAVVDNTTSALTAGAFATIHLNLKVNEAAILVPTQSIIPQERNRKIIVAEKGKARFVTVTTGIRQPSSVEIIDGVNPGDTVITTGILFLKPGAKLKLRLRKEDKKDETRNHKGAIAQNI